MSRRAFTTIATSGQPMNARGWSKQMSYAGQLIAIKGFASHSERFCALAFPSDPPSHPRILENTV